MRAKKAFSKINHSNGDFDFEKMKVTNLPLWKKLKKQFDTGRKIVAIQLYNGLDRTNEKTLRYYLSEFASRFLQYGPKSFPISFNVLEPFFIFNPHNSIIQLIEEEESYGVSLIDFLDFVTEKDFDLDDINFYDNIPENQIYHFSFTTGFDEINFSNSKGKTFMISGLSVVRQQNEVAILIQAGESYDKHEAEEYFKENSNWSFSPFKKSLGMKFENDDKPKIVNFEGRNDLWFHNVALLFNLKSKSIDIRFVARDDNTSFKVLTDDFFAIFGNKEDISKEDIEKFYNNHLKELENYDAVFDFAKYCLALPYYIFEK